jgi:hypothetical protein
MDGETGLSSKLQCLIDQAGKFAGSLQLGDFLADLASRAAHETGDLLDRIVQPDGPKDPSATIFCRYSCRAGFRYPRSSRFPDLSLTPVAFLLRHTRSRRQWLTDPSVGHDP